MGRSMARRFLIGAFVSALALLLVIATVAPTAAGLRMRGTITRTKDISIAESAFGSGRLRCPRDYRVVGGGAFWRIPVLPVTPDLARGRWIAASLPIRSGTGWYANGMNLGTDAVLQIVIHCLPADRVGRYTTRTLWLEPDGVGAAAGYVSCGTGRRIVTGGTAWQVEGGPLEASQADLSRLSGDTPTLDAKGWFGSGVRFTGSARLRIVALCRPSDAVGAYTTVVKELGLATVAGANVVTGDYLACPTRKRVVSGGAFWKVVDGAPDAKGGHLASTAPTTDRRGWYAAGFTHQYQRALSMIAHCRPR